MLLLSGGAESQRDVFVATSRTSMVPLQTPNMSGPNISGNMFNSGPPSTNPPPSYQSGRYSSLGIGKLSRVEAMTNMMI